VRLLDGEPRLLLLRCYNYWDFPKGEVEPGEAPLAAAQREFREETGLGPVSFPWGHDQIETERYGRGKVARYYIAMAPEGPVRLPISPELGHPEHHEHRWATLDEAAGLFNARLQRVLAWAAARLGNEIA